MEKARTLIVTSTAWLSFLAALWLLFLGVVKWQAPVIFFFVVVFVFSIAAYKK